MQKGNELYALDMPYVNEERVGDNRHISKITSQVYVFLPYYGAVTIILEAVHSSFSNWTFK